jgi:ATP-dependent helicase/DNAse subunit B
VKRLGRQIWTGPILGTNRSLLIQRCAELIGAGKTESFLYLAASQPLLDLVTRSLLDGEQIRGIWGSLPVFLFRGFVSRLLETAVEQASGLPIESRAVMDREELPLRRGLISQIIKRLASQDRLKAIKPLVNRDGSINSLSVLIGEIQRAAKTPHEFEAILQSQRQDEGPLQDSLVPLQSDYDLDISLIYHHYSKALELFRLTEADADQLRALDVLRGEIQGKQVGSQWLDGVRLLVIDGFFDFTPIQGEMLRLLIPRVPDVLVNFNFDTSNPSIFVPFEQTIHQLQGIADFEVQRTDFVVGDPQGLRALPSRLFNPDAEVIEDPAGTLTGVQEEPSTSGRGGPASVPVTVLDCADRETEIRRIAKEIKRLNCDCGYRLSEIAVVVRKRQPYFETIARVLQDEGIPSTVDRRVPLIESPAIRAVLKLFRLVAEQTSEPDDSLKMSELVNIIKSDYFRLSHQDLVSLRSRFERNNLGLMIEGTRDSRGSSATGLELVGRWDLDNLENVIAFVGSELRVDSWLRRARLLTLRSRPGLDRELEDPSEDENDRLEATPELDSSFEEPDRSQLARLAGPERRSKVSREVHPAAIAWSALVVDHLARTVGSTPSGGQPRNLRSGLMSLLDKLQFAEQVTSRAARATDANPAALHRSTLELRGLERLRGALNAAVKAVEYAAALGEEPAPPTITMSAYVDEVIRALSSQSLVEKIADRDGLTVLEATDIRGLRFRAVFIAGLYEGEFPLRASRDWLYPHEARERLKKYGLTLEDISPEVLLKEEHYFYQAACRGTERLFLSRPLLLEDASETVPSYYIEELRRAIGPHLIAQEEARPDYDGLEIFSASTTDELATSLIRQDELQSQPSSPSEHLSKPNVAMAIEWTTQKGFLSDSARYRVRIERERASRSFGHFDGVITNGELIQLARLKYGSEHVFSASELSLYGKCPYKFFANRLLRLEPRGEAALDLSALDAGSLLHEILRRFLSQHRNEALPDLNLEDLEVDLARVADEVFDEHEGEVPPLNPHVWRIDREIRKIVLRQVLRFELEMEQKVRRKDVRPRYFELSFGMLRPESDPSSVEDFLRLDRDDETVRLRGQIDRVDVARDGTSIAYDYKLSRGSSLEDMTEGRDLQMHIYLSALERLLQPGNEIGGGGYYVLRGGERGRNRGLYRKSKSDYTGVTGTKSVLEDDHWRQVRSEMEANIWEFIGRMRDARFEVAPTAPQQTCSFCDYSAICRYDKFRISHKRREG